MKRIRIWKGYHGSELATLIAKSWDEESLLILCPPHLKDFSFLSALPLGPLEICGEWTATEKARLDRQSRLNTLSLLPQPVLGVFTSGTLSHSPRLALYSRRGVRRSIESIYSLFDLARIRHVFCYPQAFHTFGLTLGYVAAHLYDWKLHTPKGKYSSAAHTERLACKDPALLTLGTPTHFFDLLRHCADHGVSPRPSYSCIIGGASVDIGLWLRVQRELKIQAPSVGYGCTEAAPGIAHLPPGVPPQYNHEIGFPLDSIESEVTADGVWIRGASLCMSMIQDGEIEFPRQLLIRDRIEICDDGRWLFKGRLDLVMNRGGHKIAIEEVEATLHESLGILAVACSLPDPRLGEELALAVVRNGETLEEIYKRVQAVLLERYGLRFESHRLCLIDQLPLNECSKVDRKSIKSLWTLAPNEEKISI